jgi:hypothetical protein
MTHKHRLCRPPLGLRAPALIAGAAEATPRTWLADEATVWSKAKVWRPPLEREMVPGDGIARHTLDGAVAPAAPEAAAPALSAGRRRARTRILSAPGGGGEASAMVTAWRGGRAQSGKGENGLKLRIELRPSLPLLS